MKSHSGAARVGRRHQIAQLGNQRLMSCFLSVGDKDSAEISLFHDVAEKHGGMSAFGRLTMPNLGNRSLDSFSHASSFPWRGCAPWLHSS